MQSCKDRSQGYARWSRRAPRHARCWTRSKQILLEANPDRLEAAPMDVAGAEARQRREMLGCRISLVAVETVLRGAQEERAHLGGARGLCKDRGGRDYRLTRLAAVRGPRPAS